ncbi:LysR family transcriptional regulator [Actinacidiphila sp. ITFR-21]|uniref:LysR family transcriptional regulator n=1 Tax=Actinacidiphila sp. ITFR-21 TaxID=3075199 RepID=UPI002889B7F0|nr:LysR substrate-binding domain-containing protein [Streptomyces sp. ITFR-21]WNI17238.1 LysR substrate-binding domain-containing protein [Streptomyces sp. ITFR-21]
MELRRLRYFVVLARHLHFGRAAAELRIAQPGLSQQIKVLEKELKVVLLDRGPQGVALTPAGEALLAGAGPVLSAADQLGERVRAVADGADGRLRVAYSRSGADDLVSDLIRRFRGEHPRVRVTVTTTMSAWGLRLLLDGGLDAVFVRGEVREPGVDSAVVSREEAAVVLPAGHPLAACELMDRQDLRCLPVVLWPRESGPSLYDELVGDVWPDGPPELAAEEPDFEQVVAAVAAGAGISVMDLGRARKLAPPEVAVRRFRGVPPAYAVSLAWRADEADPAVRRFVSYARGWLHARGGAR